MKTAVNKGKWPRMCVRSMRAGAPMPAFGRVVGLLECRVTYSKQTRKSTLKWANSALNKTKTENYGSKNQ